MRTQQRTQPIMRATLLSAILCVCLVLHPAAALRSLKQDSTTGTALSLSYVPEFDFYKFDEEDFSHVITISAPAPSKKANRAPVSLTAVLDRSGSMSGDKIELVKKSTEFVVEQLQEGDSVGIVSYETTVREDVPLTPVTETSKSRIRGAISEIRAGGSTNLSGGLFRGVKQQNKGDVSTATVKTVLLLTDGLANEGITDIQPIVRKMKTELDGSFPPVVYALGFGSDHDVKFLQKIAEAGRGSYVFIADESEVATSFGEIIGGLLSVTAQNVEVKLSPLGRSRIVSLKSGGRVKASLTDWTVTYTDLFAGEKRDILVDMKVPQGTNSIPVLGVTVKYFDTALERTVEKAISIVVARRSSSSGKPPNTVVEITRLRFRVAEDLETALELKENGDTEKATKLLDGTLKTIADSSAGSDTEVVALNDDVLGVKARVEREEALDDAEATLLAVSADSVTSQRAIGANAFTTGANFKTKSVSASGTAAASFVSGG